MRWIIFESLEKANFLDFFLEHTVSLHCTCRYHGNNMDLRLSNTYIYWTISTTTGKPQRRRTMAIIQTASLDCRVKAYIQQWEMDVTKKLQSTKVRLISCKPRDRRYDIEIILNIREKIGLYFTISPAGRSHYSRS